MKILRSTHNKFPQFYKECCIVELEMDVPTQKRWTKMRKKMIPSENDFLSLMSDGETLNIYKGIEQIWIAKTEGYTHISAYVIDRKDMDIINPPETNWYTKNKHLGEKACEEHRRQVHEWLKKRGKSSSLENLEEASATIEKETLH